MKNYTLDRIRGMFAGAFLGDALGAPFEWKNKYQYNGKLEYETVYNSKYQGRKTIPVGGVTDDSEMTLTLLRQILADGKYVKDNVIKAYLKWANTGSWSIGTNTRMLFRGSNGTLGMKGYTNRINKVLKLPEDERSLSNGPLMRASPLALLWNNTDVIDDVSISNPTSINRDCNLVYVSALRLALSGYSSEEIYQIIKTIPQTEAVKGVFESIENRDQRDIVSKRGFCLHALWCTLVVLKSFDNYSEAMKWVITSQKGSDTDTNACIAGALLGAIVGFDEMMKTESDNMKILLNCQRDRPQEYTPHDFYQLTEDAYQYVCNITS